jgi:Zn-dependent protease with chaperone function
MHKSTCWIILATLTCAGCSIAVQEQPRQQPGSPAGISASTAGDEGPVPVPPPTEKAVRYYQSGNVLWIVDRIWGLLIPALFLFTGFSARIRNWAQKLGRKWFFVVGIYLVIFAVLNALIDLPLTYYEEFVREHAYGLSNQTIQKWWSDSLKSLMVGLVMGFLFLWIPYLLLKKSPRRWWLYTSLLSIPFLFFVMLISPVWIDPLFNRFGPMKDKALESQILSLARQAGIEGSRVYEVEKSVDTKAVNAYVTGFMNTKRIVLWDTIIAKLNRQELMVVMAHEMGHYVLNHVVQGIMFGFLLILFTLYLAYRLADGLIERFKERFGFDRLSDIASLPLILFITGILSLAITPIALAYSRHQEHEADRFALEITKTNHAAAMAFVKLQEENLGVPRPGLLYKLWRASHPLIGERIDFCNEYRPWEEGEPLKYGGHFKTIEGSPSSSH